MFGRMAVLGIVAAWLLTAANAVVGTISSSAPININGSDMSPSLAPFWPLASKDEIANSAPALLQTAGRDLITLDANSKARIDEAGGFEYLYIRQGGLGFDARTGPIYVCIGGHLYVPSKSARGSLRLDTSGAVDSRLERGVFAEQGTRACGPDFSGDFLSGLPKAAGGSVGAQPGGLSTGAKIGIGAAAIAGSLGFLVSSAPCGSPNGCNFNPTSISQP
jgi:hypothetical protein